MIETSVILVNEQDEEIGTCEKLKAHEEGLLHRAFSVLLMNSSGEMLLQQRAMHKYHSPGLWTNACCSHPAPNENLEQAVARRMHEELNMVCTVNPLFHFVYETKFDNGLIEHELDHVFMGFCEETPAVVPEEAMDYKWMRLEELRADILAQPSKYTFWFKMIILENFETIKTRFDESR